MNADNLEGTEKLRDFLYHVREILELRDRLSSMIERLNSSFDVNRDLTESVMGELETELFFHLPYHIRELREPFERILRELYGEDAKILVDQDDE